MKKYLILSILCLTSLAANAANKYYTLTGTLGQDINFRLDLEEVPYEGIIMGQTTYYRKAGNTATIKVCGQSLRMEQEGNVFRYFLLSEFDGTKICGNFLITFFDDGSFSDGIWTHGENTYAMNNVEILPTDNPIAFFKPVDIENASGVYRFSYDSGNEEMPEVGGSLELYHYSGNVGYSACQVTPNIAETTGKIAEFYKNRFYFSVENAHYEVFTFEDAVFVKRTNPQAGHPESFGANADVAGIYIPTDEQLGEEVLALFDEEKAFDQSHPFSILELNTLWMDVLQGETTYPDEIIMKDLDGDGMDEVIARYTENKTPEYEVRNNRFVIFALGDGGLTTVAVAQGKLEDLEIADSYVIQNETNSRGTRTTHKYFKLQGSSVSMRATKTEAEIDNYTINGNTVKKKEFNKQVKANNVIRVTNLNGWQEVPGNVHRNETAARG